MQEELFKKFEHCDEFAEELESRKNKNLLLFVFNIIISISLLNYFAPIRETSDNGDLLFGIVILICLVSIVSTLYVLINISKIHSNITKNELEINSKYISGICTENPKEQNSDKYFRLEYNQIDKIEIKDINFKTESYHNLYIHHKNGTTKLSINSPEEAISIILNIKSPTIQNQVYQCPNCSQLVYLGQNSCSCGQSFDWTKL